jgi:polar amino acid transport system substrate-binding protein
MKRQLLAVFLITILVVIMTCPILAINTIKLGYWVDEPQIFVNGALDNHPKGALVDYWEKYIAPQMDVAIEWVGPLSLNRLQNSLDEGSIDASVLLAKNPERAQKFLFPSSSFTEMQPGLALLKSNPLNKIEKVADISNLKIGYMTGGVITPFMKDPSFKLDLITSNDHLFQNMQKLLTGRIDAVYHPELIIMKYVFSKHSDINNFRFLPLPEPSISLYSVFSKKANPEFIKKYEVANEKLKANYANLLKQYISE